MNEQKKQEIFTYLNGRRASGLFEAQSEIRNLISTYNLSKKEATALINEWSRGYLSKSS